MIKKLDVDINELLEVEIRYIDSDEKEVTLLIHLNKDKLNEVIETSDKYICITRPRRFSKSSCIL